MRPESLNTVVERALFFVKHELDKHHIRVIREISAKLPEIRLNRNRMEQAFVNIFSNAIQAIGDHGDIYVRGYLKKLGEGDKNVGFRKDDHFSINEKVAVIEVEDSGSGIANEIIGKIFDPFFTTMRDRGGTGLGLPVVKSIIELHHGAIDIVNSEKRGARAIIMLKIE